MTVDLTAEFEAGYRALHGEGGLVPVARDMVAVTGPQAVEFLQGQLSQDVTTIQSGTSACSFLLQPTGKVDAWFRIGPIRGGFAIDVDGGFGAAVEARLERFKLRTKVDIELAERRWTHRLVRAARQVGPGPDIQSPAIGGLQFAGGDLPTVSSEAYEAVRIECGLPAMGTELTESTIPAEVGQWILDLSVSFTKGCYTGQELVARIDSRGGNVPRHLRGLRIDGSVPPAGSAVVIDGAEVGALTSVSRAPGLGGAVALAYLGRKVEPPADAVVRWEGGEAPARVESLPLR